MSVLFLQSGKIFVITTQCHCEGEGEGEERLCYLDKLYDFHVSIEHLI